MQTKKFSMIETAANAVTGYIIASAVNWYAIPFFYPSVQSTVKGSVGLVLLFTAVSMARSYLLRRFFVRLEGKRNEHRRLS